MKEENNILIGDRCIFTSIIDDFFGVDLGVLFIMGSFIIVWVFLEGDFKFLRVFVLGLR